MAQLNFDARTVAPDQGQQDPVPAGWYKVVMDKSEMKPTKDGTGQRLEMQFKIIDGQFTGRKIFEGLNLVNSNPVAQEIAYKQLSAICHAVNVLVAQDSSQLHNIPLQVKVNLKPASGQYEAKNEVKAYKNINEVVQAAPVAAPGAPASFAPPPAAPAAFAPPAAPAAAGWQPPAAPQPWQAAPAATAAPAAAPAWQPPAAPVAPAMAAPAPVAAPVAAPAAAAPVAQPAWAAAPAPAAAPVEAAPAAPAPAAAPAGITPPWAAAPAQ